MHSGSATSLEACVGCGAALGEARCPHCGVAAAPGGFRVERVLAESPHARVYLARDTDGRAVALKELQFSRVPSVQELDAFEREAGALRSLRHRGIPSYVASFREGQGVGLRLYLAAEYVVGETLAARIARGPVPRDEVLAIAQQLLDVLADLQRRSPPVLHRDLKPANVLLRPDGSVVLVDFGSVRTLSAERTHGSTLVGTFGYMPPEQLGGTVDRTSDLYALGATLLHALTGKPPMDWLDGGLQIQVPPGAPGAVRPVAARGADARSSEDVPRTRRQRGRCSTDAPRWPLDSDSGAAPPWAWSERRWRSAGGRWCLARVSGIRPVPPAGTTRPVSPAEAWLTRMRPHCNTVEAVQTVLRQPPPEGAEGAGAGAACLALGGKMDAARKRILALPEGQRPRAASVVFDAGHPVADMGDDVSAAPIMQLVLEFWPENFQALYHAGMSEYALGRPTQARPLLERFMALYHLEDGFTRAARRALERIQYGLPAESGPQPEH